MLHLGFEHGELVPGVRVGHLAGGGPGSWLGAAPRCSCDSWLAAAEVGHGAGLQQLRARLDGHQPRLAAAAAAAGGRCGGSGGAGAGLELRDTHNVHMLLEQLTITAFTFKTL